MKKEDIKLLEEIKAYTQKSKAFIWPLLKINVSPLETYFQFDNVKKQSNERLLIALFYNKNPEYLKNKELIESNKNYDFTFSDDDYDYVTFNCDFVKNDYDKILNGEYSQLSKETAFFLFTNSKNKTVLAAINPKTYFAAYESALGLPENSLKHSELLSKPNLNEETITVSKSTLNQIIEAYCFELI